MTRHNEAVNGVSCAAKDAFFASASSEFNYGLIASLRSRAPLLLISTKEDYRLSEHVNNLCKFSNYKFFTWDSCHGLKAYSSQSGDMHSHHTTSAADPIEVLDAIENLVRKSNNDNSDAANRPRGLVFLLFDFYQYISKSDKLKIKRKIRHLSHNLRGATLIFTCSSGEDNGDLAHLMEVLSFPLPNSFVIEKILDKVISLPSVTSSYPDLQEYVNTNKEDIVNAVRGLTAFEIESTFTKNIAVSHDMGNQPLDPTMLIREKKGLINKSSALEYVDSDCSLDHIGGLNNLSEWVRTRTSAFSSKAKEYGISTPKGVMLIGVPGGGKSATAKAISSEFKQPLVRLDFGKLMDSYVGSSEKNVREAIHLAETLAPCVTGDTVIWDASGEPYQISDLMDLVGEQPFFINAFNEETLKIEKTQVEAVIKQPKKKSVWRIITAHSSIVVTGDHKIMVIRNGNLIWEKARKIQPGDMVATPKRCSYESSLTFQNILDNLGLYLKDNAITSSSEDDSGYLFTSSNSVDIRSCSYMAGMIDGAGFASDGVVMLENLSKQTLSDFMSFIRETFAIEVSEFGPSSDDLEYYECSIRNDIFCAIINYLIDNIFKFGIEAIQSYLAGFFATASSCQSGRNSKISLEIGEMSVSVRARLSHALHCIGIVAPMKTQNSLYISSQAEIEAFARNVIPYMRLHSHKEQATRVVADSIKTHNNAGYVINKSDNEQELISQDIKESEIVDMYPDNKDILNVFNSDIIGVKVLAVEKAGRQFVYDLACKDNHNFFGNDILCHNCVLWVDEIEKALAAAVGKGSGDGGATKRVISYFLTWLAEKKKPVFVVCTANNVEDIPPEFMRAGRFDEVFFIDLPSDEGKAKILEIMLSKRGFDLSGDLSISNIEEIVKDPAFDQFSGAEVEKAVDNAMFVCFLNNEDMTVNHIRDAASEFKPLAMTRSMEIQQMRDWAEGVTRRANS